MYISSDRSYIHNCVYRSSHRIKERKKTFCTAATAPTTRTEMGELDLGEAGGLSEEE